MTFRKSYLPWLRLEVYQTSIGTKFAKDHWRPNHLRISTWLWNRTFRPFLMPKIRHGPKAHGSWHIQALLFYVHATVFHGIYRYVSVWLVLMLEFQLFHFSWPKSRKKTIIKIWYIHHNTIENNRKYSHLVIDWK